MTLITTNTSSNAASSSFTSSIDSTYKLYIFKFIDVNPATNAAEFTFNGSIDGGSNYNVTKTTTSFNAYHSEGGGSPAVSYDTTNDLAQSTAFVSIAMDVSYDADSGLAGTLWLFNPSDTTYVTHFYSTIPFMGYSTPNYQEVRRVGGYFNSTDNIDAVQFKMSSGNFDGTIKMYGVG